MNQFLGNAMTFPRYQPFVKMLLDSAVQAYNDQDTYLILGPSHMTRVARNFTRVKNVLDIKPERSQRRLGDRYFAIASKNLLIFRQNHISGVASHGTPHLFNSPLSRNGWKHLLREASSVHFTASFTSKYFPCIDREDPESSAYSLLAPHLCPVALYSEM